MTDTARRIPEIVIPGRRLGRHVPRRDPRSLAYLVPETATPVTKRWDRRTPVLDQGDLGSCTGNAAAGALGTDPLYPSVPAGTALDEAEAVRLYAAATSLDDYAGAYPPDDTGSDGLSVAKACKAAGLISGYVHMTSVAACQTAIQAGPFIVGSDWYEGFDNPGADGLVHISGSVRGGHEYECIGYDAATDTWELVNSWGASWGKAGHFFYTSATLAKLLASDGDATQLVPLSQPAPTPTPAPITKTFTAEAAKALDQWADAPHWWRRATKAAKAWKAAS